MRGMQCIFYQLNWAEMVKIHGELTCCSALAFHKVVLKIIPSSSFCIFFLLTVADAGIARAQCCGPVSITITHVKYDLIPLKLIGLLTLFHEQPY